MAMTLSLARAITGGLGKPSKMPGTSYGIPAAECKVGGKLRAIPNSVCSNCYALKGRYIFPNVTDAQYRRLASLTHPQWVEAMAFLLNRTRKQSPLVYGEGVTGWHRWHDAGDLQDMAHLLRIVEVCELTPTVKHWLPTREKALVLSYKRQFGEFPDNLCVRVSAAMIDGDAPDVSLPVSAVYLDGAPTGHACPAKALYGGKCGPCRACWDKGVKLVSYPWH